MNQSKFPEPITKLPKADIPFKGCTAYLSQGKDHQIVFWEFSEEIDFPEHSHEAQWGVVINGKIGILMEEEMRTFKKGDCYYIPAGVKHSGKIYAGYADVTFFAQKDRYKIK